MCGICGYYSRKNISLEELKLMNDTLYHRGPDDGGIEIYEGKEEYFIGLAHRRLSIQDLSQLGHQPMHSVDGRVSIVFNGEIYNFGDIRKELSDYPFRSRSDTEVILASFLKWGIKCIDRFRGMFSFALYDREDESIYLVRDRMGKKPLYYWEDGENIVFASELKPIMKYPYFSEGIRENILKRYLTVQYINAPDTIFQNVYQVKPGSIYQFKLGQKKQWNYWEIGERYRKLKETSTGSFNEEKENLDKLLNRAVRERMISDVPVGTFLSGGYDSSLVTAIAQKNSKEAIKTFSIGFHDKSYNEAKYAKEVAKYLGTDHTEMYIGEQDLFEMIDGLVEYYDEPFADSSQIPSMLVSYLAKQKVTVALSGDGGDELFCGYNIYTMLLKMQRLDPFGKMLYDFCNFSLWNNRNMMEKFPSKIQIVAANRDNEIKVQPFDYFTSIQAESLLKFPQKEAYFEEEKKYREKNWQVRRMLLDMETYLPGDILTKVDRASMKYSLETRCPFLDSSIVEYSFTLPHKFKYYKGNKKYILKELTHDYIPRNLLERPKTGFSVPLEQWLKGGLRDQLLDYSEKNYLKKQGIFIEEKTRTFIEEYLKEGETQSGKKYSRMVWAFFIFQKWYERYRT